MFGMEDRTLSQMIIGSLPFFLRIMRENYAVSYLELDPNPTSPLYINGDNHSVYIPCCRGFGFETLVNRAHNLIQYNFFTEFLKKENPLCLVDIGSHVGLTTRQLLIFGNIQTAFIYEPYKPHFQKSLHNLKSFSNVVFNNAGLDTTNGRRDLYLDLQSSGNFSLYEEAFRRYFPKEKLIENTTDIKVLNIFAESKKWAENDCEFLYKSDTQGHDELLFSSINQVFLEKIRAGYIEVWRLKQKSYDLDVFIDNLSNFNNFRFERSPKIGITINDIRASLLQRNGRQDDILFWR